MSSSTSSATPRARWDFVPAWLTRQVAFVSVGIAATILFIGWWVRDDVVMSVGFIGWTGTVLFSFHLWMRTGRTPQVSTPHNRLDASIIENEKRWLSILQTMPAMLMAFDESGKIVMWNRECERITGYPAGELVGNPQALLRLIPDDVRRERLLAEWASRGDDYHDWEWDITCRDNTVKTIAWSNVAENFPIADWLTWSVGVDVTERKRVQSLLLRAKEDLEIQVAQRTADLVTAYDATIEGWSRALDMRDHETEGHSRRVAEITMQLAQKMNLPAQEYIHVRRGALLHDIGKIAIPDEILLKPGALTEQERKVMQRHPVYALNLLSPIRYLRLALDIPYSHHERWDGTGYPQGLKGEEIPLAARLFAIIDTWDALNSDRPYRKAWQTPAIEEYLREMAGKQFDPTVVPVFLELLKNRNAFESKK